MSLDIKHIIIHRINKEKNSTYSVKLQLADELLPTKNCNFLVTKLNNTFNSRTSKQYGSFDKNNTDDSLDSFSNLLSEYYNKDTDDKFIEFTRKSMDILKNKMNPINFATGGDILFVRYEYQDEDYVIVMMLKIKESFSITDELKIKPITHINDDEIDSIVRINLSLWNTTGAEKYISFTKKGKSGDVSLYFAAYIGCTEYVNSSEMTNDLVKAIKGYVKDTTPINEVDQKFKDIIKYITDKSKKDKIIDLSEIDTYIDTTRVRNFIKYLNDNNYTLSNNFPVDVNLLNKLNRFTYKTSGFSISADKDFLNNNVEYDSKESTLKVKITDQNFKSLFDEFNND